MRKNEMAGLGGHAWTPVCSQRLWKCQQKRKKTCPSSILVSLGELNQIILKKFFSI